MTQSLFWVSFITYSTKVLGFISTLILAKLLDPKDFGLMGIAGLVIATIGLVKQLGFNVALIQRQDDSVKVANTAFTLIFTTSILLYFVCYGFAPFAAKFFNNQAVDLLIKVLALSMIIGSLSNVQSTLLQKKMEFKKKVVPDVLPRIGYISVAVTLAYLDYGVWSLVFATLFSSVIGVILYWIISPYKPRFEFDKKIAKELFGFGKWVVASFVVIFIFTNIDDAFIGKFLDVTNLGYYSFAYWIAYLPATNITFLVSTVTLPVFSSLQNETERLKKIYLKTVKNVAIFVIPISFALIIFARPVLEVIYGDKWLPSVACLQILAIYGLIVSLLSPAENILLALGKSKISFFINLISVLAFLPFIYHVTINFGIVGVCVLMTVAIFISVYLLPWYINKSLEIKIHEFLNCFKIPFLVSIFLSIVFYVIQYISIINVIAVMLLSILYIISYLFISYWLDSEFRLMVISVISKISDK